MRCPTPLTIDDEREWTKSDKMEVPCGKCGACQKNRRADWSFRLSEEMKNAVTGYFITLTYDDDNIPLSDSGIPTLDKSDVQKFIKIIRKRNKAHWPDEQLRYYLVGEYGSKTNRPHYHLIAFNIYPDLAEHLAVHWKHGFVTLGTVTPKSIHYVTKYHVNTRKHEEQYTDPDTGEVFSRNPEFATMSRNPGIGKNYVNATRKWHRQNNATYVINNGYKQRLPRYFREKLFSKMERCGLAGQNQKEDEKRYWLEYDRLRNDHNITDPDRYMFNSRLKQAESVKHKMQDNDKI